MADDPASTLAAIHQRAEQAAPALAARRGLNSMADSAADVPCLLAAVEAALELADSASVMAAGETMPPQPVAWDLDPAKLRADITAALGGTPEVPLKAEEDGGS